MYVEGPVPPEKLATYSFHEGLVAFRPPKQQQQAIIEIAGLPEGRIIIIRNEDIIVGYIYLSVPRST